MKSTTRALLPALGAALLGMILAISCRGGNTRSDSSTHEASDGVIADTADAVQFDADSAYAYVERQVAFGPRVPNTEAHRLTGEWLQKELRRHGATVSVQNATLKAFDGTPLKAMNILGQYNPEATERVLLLAHWDTRPWADADPDPSHRSQPVDGANDGASGVGVLLEIARQLNKEKPAAGIDILFVDAEDYGTHNDEESWALGARYFVNNPPVEGYRPQYAILLDMVGGPDARFHREYFSQQAAPGLCDAIWAQAAQAGYGNHFRNAAGAAVTDDHVQFIEAGIPAIDIIEYNPASGGAFNPRWHTADDNMQGISRATLKAVGQTVLLHLLSL